MEETVVDLRLLLDFLEQRHDGLAQGGEEVVQHFHIHAALILVQEGIVGLLGGVIVTGELPVIVHQLLQHRAEGSEIVLFFGLVPDIAGTVGQLAVCHILIRRDPGQLVAAAAQFLHLTAMHKVQLIQMAAQLLQ